MGALNPRLAQQQMGLELLRRRAEIGQGAGSTGMDLLQQHQQQQVQYMAARNGIWPQNVALQGHGLHSRMMEGGGGFGLPSRATTGQGSLAAGDGDGFGTLQTEHVEIDGKLHTMFCVRPSSPPRPTLGLQGPSFDSALGYTPFDYSAPAEMGILGDGLVDSRWMQPMSPRRAPPAMASVMSSRRSRSPQGSGLYPRRSPPRRLPGASYHGNPSPFHRQEGAPRHPVLGFEPHLLPNQHLLSQQPSGWMSPRSEAVMLRQNLISSGNDYLPRGRDLVGPTGRDYHQRNDRDSSRSGFNGGSLRNGRGASAASDRTGPREGRRGRSRERNRERPRNQVNVKKHALPLEQAIAAKKSKIAENARREGEENAFDELILFEDREETEEFQTKVDKSHAHYSKVLKEDTIRRRKYEAAKNGRAKKLECLGCGSKKFSDLTSLVTHAIQATDVRKRADHQGFHRALCELLGWNSLALPENKRSVSRSGTKSKDSDDTIVWPPTVIVENTRTKKTGDGRWVGMTTTDMTTFLKELGHHQGRPRPIWDTEGHRGFMLVEFLATRESLAEAERLHRHFEANARGRKEWERVQPFWESHLEDDNADEGPEFVRLDETSQEKTNVFYGYLALARDLPKFAIGKRAVKWSCVSKQDVLALGGPAPGADVDAAIKAQQ